MANLRRGIHCHDRTGAKGVCILCSSIKNNLMRLVYFGAYSKKLCSLLLKLALIERSLVTLKQVFLFAVCPTKFFTNLILMKISPLMQLLNHFKTGHVC
jgi:hypothetical protein